MKQKETKSCPVCIARVSCQWMTALKTNESKSVLEKKTAVERSSPTPLDCKATQKDA